MHEPLLSSAAKEAVGSQDPLACCSRTMACKRSVGDRGGTKGAAAGPAREEPEETEGAHSRSTTRDRFSASIGAGAPNRSAMVAVVVAMVMGG